MGEAPIRTRAAALGIAALYLAFGAAYVLRTPIWQNPDEPAHYNYIQHIARGDGLPVLALGDYDQAYLERITAERFPSDLPIESIRYESHQPPLYYLAMTPTGGSVLAVRLTSLALGLVLLALTWAIGRTLFPTGEWLAVGMLAFVALLPQHLANAASVNNDILAEVLVAGILLATLRGSAPAVAGLLLGGALITKTTVYAAAVAPLMTLRWSSIIPAYGVALTVALPWWLRNAAVYGGADILGLARHAEVVAGQPAVQTWTPGHIREALTTLFQSFWLQLGWMSVPAEPWVYNLLAVASGLIVTGAAISLKSNPSRGLVLCAVLFVLVIAQTIVYNAQFLQPQGRYLFPALIPIAVFVALGLREITGQWYGAGVGAMVAGLAALNLYAHAKLVPLLMAD